MNRREWHILNLGAGVQSTTLWLLSNEGEILEFDFAIFSDTQEEPAEVYAHLEWIKARSNIPILVRTKGKLGDHLMKGTNSTGGRFASIPVFTKSEGGKPGKTRRQCSKEYKIEVIEATIRRDILGLKPRQRIPRDVIVHQYYGISLDEAGRANRIALRAKKKKWLKVHFPLLDRNWTRGDCLKYLATRIPHRVPKSACVFCPFHDDAEWLRLKTECPDDFARAVEIDEALRVPGNVVNRKMNKKMYVHRSCVPLVQIEFKPASKREKQFQTGFWFDCQGVCGN